MEAVHLSPGEYAIKVFGGVRAMARAAQVVPSTAARWRKHPDRMHQRAQRNLIEAAVRAGLDLTPADLVLGRDVA